jgi:hypothetical protein
LGAVENEKGAAIVGGLTEWRQDQFRHDYLLKHDTQIRIIDSC